jgi:hypothetical protein
MTMGRLFHVVWVEDGSLELLTTWIYHELAIVESLELAYG